MICKVGTVQLSVQWSIIVWSALGSKFKSFKINVQFTCIGVSFPIEFLRFFISKMSGPPDKGKCRKRRRSSSSVEGDKRGRPVARVEPLEPSEVSSVSTAMLFC